VPSEQPEPESNYQFPNWYARAHLGFAAYAVGFLLFGLTTDRSTEPILESTYLTAMLVALFAFGLVMLTKGVGDNPDSRLGRWVFRIMGASLLFFAVLGPIAVSGLI